MSNDNLVEERVVRMRFDNKQFGQGIAQTVDDLEKLEKSMKFEDATKDAGSIEKAYNAINFSPLQKAIEKTSSSFNALEMVAFSVINRITNKAMDAGESLIKSLSIDNISSGWNKYLEKTSSVQTLANSTGKSISEINGYLSKLMWFSDETSYSFSEMTSSLAQLSSSGGDVEKLIPMIEGIANATSFAGKSSAEFSRAIYNLNQSYSAGSLQYMDWKSLELAGVASSQLKQTFIDEAKALGKLTKEGKTAEGTLVTLSNFGTTLKEKWADVSVMEAAFGKFASATQEAYKMVQAGEVDTASQAYAKLEGTFDSLALKAAKSAQEATSFNQAITATKDAVSSAWMRMFEQIFGNYDEAKVLWTQLSNDLYDMFVPGLDAKAELLEEWHSSETGGYKDFIEGATAMLQGFKNIVSTVSAAISHVFPPTTLTQLQKFTSKFKIVGEKFKEITSFVAPVTDAVSEVANTIGNAGDVINSTVTETSELLEKLAKQVIKGDYGNGQVRFDALDKLGYSYEIVQNKVNELLGCSYRYNVEGKTLIKTENSLAKSEANVANAMSDSSDAREDVTESTSDLVDKSTEATSIGEKIYNTVTGLSSVVSILAEAIKAVNKVIVTPIIKTVVPKALNLILTITSNIGKKITEVADYIKTNNSFVKFLEEVVNLIKNIKSFISDTIESAKGLESVQTFLANIEKFGNAINNIKVSFLDKLSSAWNKISSTELFKDFSVNLLPIAISGIDLLFKGLNGLIGILSPLGDLIGKTFGFLVSKINLQTLSVGIQNVAKNLGAFGEVITNIFNGLNKSGLQSKVKYSFKSLIIPKNVLDGMSTYNKIKTVLSTFAEEYIDFSKVSLDSSNRVKTAGDKFSKASASIFDGAKAFLKPVADSLGPIGNTFERVLKKVSRAIKRMDLSDIIGFMKQVIGSYVIFQFVKTIVSITSSISLLVSSIAHGTESIAGILKSFERGLTSIQKSISNVFNAVAMTALSVSLIALAGAVLVIASSIKLLSDIPSDQLRNSVVAVIAIVAALTGVMYALSKMGTANISMTAFSIAAVIGSFTAAILGMIYAFKQIAEITTYYSNYGEALLILSGIVVGLYFVIKYLAKLGNATTDTNWKETLTTSVMILSFAKAIKTVVETLGMLVNYKLEEIAPALIELAAIMFLLSKLAAASKGLKVSNALGVAAIAGGIYIMCFAIDKVVSMDLQKIANGIPQIAIVFGLLYAASSIIKKAGDGLSSVGKSIAGIGVAIFLISVAFKIFDTVSLSTMINATLCMTSLIIAMGIFLKIATLMNSNKTEISGMFSTLIGLGTCLLLTAVAIRILGTMSTSDILKGTIAINTLILSLTLFSSQAKNLTSNMKPILALAAMVGIIAVSLMILSEIDFVSLATSTIALTVIINSLKGVIKNLSGIQTDVKSATISLVTIGVILGLAVVAISMINDIGIASDKTLVAIFGLSAIILALSAATKLVCEAGKYSAFALEGIKAMIEVTAVMVVLIGALIALTELLPAGLTEKLCSGLERIGKALGVFVGNIVGGAMEGFTASLPTVIQNIKLFTDGIAQLPDDLSDKFEMLKDVFNIIGDISKIQLETSISTLLESITGKNSLSKLISELVGVSSETEALYNSDVGLGKPNQSKPKGIIDMLVEVANKCEVFADDSKLDGLYNAADAMEALSKVLDSIPNTGGLEQKIIGEPEWKTLADNLPLMGEALTKFNEHVKGLTDGDVTATEQACKMIEVLSNNLKDVTPTGGIFQDWFGEKNWSTLGDGLEDFGETVVKFVNKFNGLKPRDAILATDMISTVTYWAKELASAQTSGTGYIDSAQNSFTGWKKISEGLIDFGSSIKDALFEMKDISNTNIDTFKNVMDAVASPLKDYDYNSLLSNSYAIIDLGNNISQFLTTVQPFLGNSDGSGGINMEFLQNIITGIKDILQDFSGFEMEPLQDFGSQIMNAILFGMTQPVATGIDTESGAAKSENPLLFTLQTLVSQMVTKIGVLANDLKGIGNTITSDMSDGMSDKKKALTKIDTAIATIVSHIKDKFKEYADAFKQIGRDIVSGLVLGMTEANSLSSVRAAGTLVGKTAYDASKAAVDSNSPSKKYEELGYFCDTGLANGMMKTANAVAEAGRYIGETAIESTQSALSGIDGTVTPVIDLSQARRSSSQLSNMMSRNQALSANASFNLNAQNDDVARLVTIGTKLLQSVQNGSDLYLDEDILVGRINRRLGQL